MSIKFKEEFKKDYGIVYKVNGSDEFDFDKDEFFMFIYKFKKFFIKGKFESKKEGFSKFYIIEKIQYEGCFKC